MGDLVTPAECPRTAVRGLWGWGFRTPEVEVSAFPPRTVKEPLSRELNDRVRASRDLELRAATRSRGFNCCLRHYPSRGIEAVECFQITTGQCRRVCYLARRFVLPVDLHRVGLLQVSIQDEDCDFSILWIQGSRSIYEWNLTQLSNFVR